ncbi:MAG: hypothetical protein DWQ01_18560 [Planctomycetota bacterium]|nr:MAG: hypothetical protein DWQ01_18560 [Planctomycetota bacterium]
MIGITISPLLLAGALWLGGVPGPQSAAVEHESALDYRISDPSALTLDVYGVCGVWITISVSGATPNSWVAVGASRNSGHYVISSGRCSGVALGLASPVRLAANIHVGPSGAAAIGFPALTCGYYFQAVDTQTCAVSNLVYW